MVRCCPGSVLVSDAELHQCLGACSCVAAALPHALPAVSRTSCADSVPSTEGELCSPCPAQHPTASQGPCRLLVGMHHQRLPASQQVRRQHLAPVLASYVVSSWGWVVLPSSPWPAWPTASRILLVFIIDLSEDLINNYCACVGLPCWTCLGITSPGLSPALCFRAGDVSVGFAKTKMGTTHLSLP